MDQDSNRKKVIQTGQDTVFMTHGHLSNVRFGLTQLAIEARAATADMVFLVIPIK